MRRLVAEDIQAGVAAAKHDEGQNVTPPGIEVASHGDNPKRQREGVQHRADIAHIVDVAEFIAQLALGHAANIEPIGGQNIRKQICRRHHRGRRAFEVWEHSHNVMIHYLIVMDKLSNRIAWVGLCFACGSDEFGMACNDR